MTLETKTCFCMGKLSGCECEGRCYCECTCDKLKLKDTKSVFEKYTEKYPPTEQRPPCDNAS